MIVPLWSSISSFRAEDFGFFLSLGLILLNLLMLINAIHELTHIQASFIVKDFLKSCFVWSPTLKVLMATSYKSPSISLNVS